MTFQDFLLKIARVNACMKELASFVENLCLESNHYAITVLIGEGSNSSTDVDVHVRLIGSHGDSGDIILKRPK